MNFISEDFHLHYLASYTLYVQSDFKDDFLVVVNDTNEVIVFLRYDNLQPSAEVVRMLSLPFTNVIVGMPHQNLIWVPADVYDESEKVLYEPYFLDENVDNILSKNIVGVNAVALYQYDQLLLSRWKKIFPQAKFVANFEVLLRQSMPYVSDIGAVLGVHVYDKQTDMFLFVNGEFKLFNSFEVTTVNDLSYFVINLFKNFGVSGKVQKVLLSGVELDSEWIVRLGHYTEETILLQANNQWKSEDVEVQKALIALNILADTKICV